MQIKTLCVAITIATFSLASPAIAKNSGEKGRGHEKSARGQNSNRQSDPDSLRGQERADEREELHDQHDSHQYGNQYGNQYGEQYRNQQPRYQLENPVDSMIDRGSNQLRQGAQELNRRAIDGLNNNLPIPPTPQPYPVPQQPYRR